MSIFCPNGNVLHSINANDYLELNESEDLEEDYQYVVYGTVVIHPVYYNMRKTHHPLFYSDRMVHMYLKFLKKGLSSISACGMQE